MDLTKLEILRRDFEASDARGDAGQLEDFSDTWHGDWSSWHEDGQPGQEAASVPESGPESC